MNSTRSWLALATTLGSLALIGSIVPHPVPQSPPKPPEFQAMSASVTVHLEDDLPQLDDGLILGELRTPMAPKSERTPNEATPPNHHKANRDQTRANALSERIATEGLAMIGDTSLDAARSLPPHHVRAPSLRPSSVP